MDEKQDKKELNFITDENELNIPVLVEALFTKYIGLFFRPCSYFRYVRSYPATIF